MSIRSSRASCFPPHVRERAMALLLEHYYRGAQRAKVAAAGFHLDNPTPPPPPPIIMANEKGPDWNEQQSREERTAFGESTGALEMDNAHIHNALGWREGPRATRESQAGCSGCSRNIRPTLSPSLDRIHEGAFSSGGGRLITELHRVNDPSPVVTPLPIGEVGIRDQP